uniref:Uncharacterized protein n=1 Tax=Cacopsylla melanoneura TaxID=428564 RepID=A0A8D8ZCN3_9HEMI
MVPMGAMRYSKYLNPILNLVNKKPMRPFFRPYLYARGFPPYGYGKEPGPNPSGPGPKGPGPKGPGPLGPGPNGPGPLGPNALGPGPLGPGPDALGPGPAPPEGPGAEA